MLPDEWGQAGCWVGLSAGGGGGTGPCPPQGTPGGGAGGRAGGVGRLRPRPREALWDASAASCPAAAARQTCAGWPPSGGPLG